MKRAGYRSLPSWGLAAALLGLLAALAALQYHWLGEVSDAERERTQGALERQARLFSKEFDYEITRIFQYSNAIRAAAFERDFAASPSVQDVEAFYELWNEHALVPKLVAEVLLAAPDPQRTFRLTRYDPAAGELVETPWTDPLEHLKSRLANFQSDRSDAPEVPAEWLDPQTPAVLLPFMMGPPRRGPPRGEWRPPSSRAPEERSRSGRRGQRSSEERRRLGRDAREMFRIHRQVFLVFRLDPRPLLERLAYRHFATGEDLDFIVRVLDRESGRTIYEAGPGSMAPGAVDASGGLFGYLAAEDAPQLPEPAGHHDGYANFFLTFFSQAERPWTVAVTHPSGSLEAAVASTRRRNLALSLGILLVLATTVVMLLRATRRSQLLARQQLEFVAGVTHELRTPLAAMRSAGENLADGVVREASQVARYGNLIAHEGRRLSDMVEQVLEYAGIQSGRRAYHREETPVADLVEGALAESRPLLGEKGFEVVVDVAEDLPPLMVDPPAIRRALGNLIANALKYGQAGGWIALSARRAGKEVCLSVEDRGQGIAQEDLPHVFEPFYRGRELSAGRIPGSGLGLSLVRHVCEAHGGDVSVVSREGEGSIFTLHLPSTSAAMSRDNVGARACEA